MDSSLVIVVPVLRRPHRVMSLVESIEAGTPEPHHTLFVISPDDPEERKAVAEAIAWFPAIGFVVTDWPGGTPGDFAKKTNLGYRSSTEAFIFCGADDLVFQRGWWPRALMLFRSPRVGVVGTNDLGNPRVIAGQHATHPVVRRTYADQYGTIDERGKIYHEGYPHVFTDDELVHTAKARGAWRSARNSIVEHRHPHWGKGETDEVYAISDASVAPGRELFMARKKLWSRHQANQQYRRIVR